jgi:hypothetical protein
LFPTFQCSLLAGPLFSLSWQQNSSKMTSRRREYHVDCCAKKAAIFFVACEPNTATRVKILDAMRIRGYSQSKAANQALQMQVRREAEKIKGEAIPGPPAPKAAAVSVLLSLSTTANVGRVALVAITPVLAAGPILLADGVAALPSPPRKMQKILHQEQIARQNERKRRAVQGQAHACATIGSSQRLQRPRNARIFGSSS